MEKIIIEAGSTVTKIDYYDGENIKRLKDKTFLFKKNYAISNCLKEEDVQELIDLVNLYKQNCDDIYACGTSIFRKLNENERKDFLEKFKKETGYDFHIISEEDENRLTVLGATRLVKNKVCVFIGGGGSTEIAIYDKGIIEEANTSFGVVDVMNRYPDLADDIAKTPLKDVMSYIKDNLNLPKNKVDTLILAGGGHERFAKEAKLNYELNNIYIDDYASIMMDINTRINDTKNYFNKVSLNEIKSRFNDPAWWDFTRAMCACVLVVAEEVGAKVIVPTNISMTFGILQENNFDK